MDALFWLMVLLLGPISQTPSRIALEDLIRTPDQFAEKTVEIRAAWFVAEEYAYLCSGRVDLDKPSRCEPVMLQTDSSLPDKDRRRLNHASNLSQTGQHTVWLTLRGRFEAADAPKWGLRGPLYRYRFLAERVLDVKAEKKRN
jgi:hypothetical protein